MKEHIKLNNFGIISPLLLVGAAILVVVLLVAYSEPFSSQLLSTIFPKNSSFAAAPGVVFVDSDNQPISSTTVPMARVMLTSPWGVQGQVGADNSLINLIPEANAQTATGTTVNATLSASGNANEDGSFIANNQSKLWIGNGTSTTKSFTGLRYTGVNIPKGAKITSAKLKIYSSQVQWIGVSTDIFADNSANSAVFSNSARPSQRQLTSAKAAYSKDDKWNKNRYYDIADVSAVVQEIVNRSDWNSGNSMSLILKGTGGAYGRKFVAGKGTNGAKLTITYIGTGGTGGQASAAPSAAASSAPSVAPSPSPTPYVVSAKIAEDGGFTKNVKDISPFTTNPTYVDYMFSDTNFGSKTVYAKFVSSTGEEKTYSSSIQYAQVTASASPSGSQQMGNDSMAMMAWRVGGKNAPNPAYDKCDDGADIVAAHNKYYVTAYDEKNYPTWHPPVVNNPVTGVGKCYFGHEHGTDPQKYIRWDEIVEHFGKDINGNGTIEKMVIAADGSISPGDHAGIPFGMANEHMNQYYNQEGRDSIFVRHEDHVGHKIEIVNNEAETQGNSTHTMTQLPGTNGISVPYYTSGTNTYKPTGVVCTHLHKFHQGTHSGDAIRNNLHEVIFHSDCQSVAVNGIDTPSLYPNNKVILTGMMAFGKPGEYVRFCFNDRFTKVCPDGKNPDGSCKIDDPLISKLPDAINSNSLGRNMVDKYCFDNFQQLNPGINYFNPYEIWEGDLRIQKADGDMLAEHGRQWDVLDPIRYVDPAEPSGFGYVQNRCNQNLPYSGNCDRGTKGAAWNSPQAAFKGLQRTTYFGRNRISNSGGSEIWWTDPLGGNAAATQFPSGLKQKISTVEADMQKVQSRIQQLYGNDNFLNDRALQRYFDNGGNTVHAPN